MFASPVVSCFPTFGYRSNSPMTPTGPTIRKDKPAKKAGAARTTYTLRYFVRETETRQLF